MIGERKPVNAFQPAGRHPGGCACLTATSRRERLSPTRLSGGREQTVANVCCEREQRGFNRHRDGNRQVARESSRPRSPFGHENPVVRTRSLRGKLLATGCAIAGMKGLRFATLSISTEIETA